MFSVNLTLSWLTSSVAYTKAECVSVFARNGWNKCSFSSSTRSNDNQRSVQRLAEICSSLTNYLFVVLNQ